MSSFRDEALSWTEVYFEIDRRVIYGENEVRERETVGERRDGAPSHKTVVKRMDYSGVWFHHELGR